MLKTKSLKKLLSFIMILSFSVGFVSTGFVSATATGNEEDSVESELIDDSIDDSSENPVITSSDAMRHFVIKVRWGNAIGEPEVVTEANFDGSITVSEDAKISLQKKLLFEEHNETADKITSENDTVSWNSLIYNHYDGVAASVSSPANDNVTIIAGEGTVTKTAEELYSLTDQLIENLDNGREIVIEVFPAKENTNFFLKVFWGKIDKQGYNERKCLGNSKNCLLPLLNADGLFTINSGGTLQFIKPLRFESPDEISSSTDAEIEWTSRLFEGIDGILVNIKMNAGELDNSDTVTMNFTEQGDWTEDYKILDLLHNGYTEDIIKDGYGVAFQVWKKANRQLIRVKNKMTVYVIEDGVKRPIPSEEVLASQGLTFDDVEVVEQEEADTYADGDATNYADGTIVQEEGTPEVYVIENGEKKHIQDPGAFIGLGYSWGNIVRVKAGILGLYRNGNPLQADSIHPEGALIRVAGNSKVYVIEGGRRVPISDIQLFNARRYDWGKVLVVNENQANKFALGESLTYPDGSLLRAENGNIYRINQGKKEWIRSADDFRKAGYKAEKVLDVADFVLSGFEDGLDVVADDIVE